MSIHSVFFETLRGVDDVGTFRVRAEQYVRIGHALVEMSGVISCNIKTQVRYKHDYRG